jgi:hypothetical protein
VAPAGGLPPHDVCPQLHGRFVVREIVFISRPFSASLESFSADFEVRCAGHRAGLRGSIRIGIGDRFCRGALDGARCDDGDACTTGDTCSGGRCGAGPPAVCGDDDPLTADRCRTATGCVFSPVESRWTVHGATRAAASAGGRTVRRRVEFDETIVLRADGSYEIPSSQAPCGALPDPIPELGSWTAARRGRLALTASNLHELPRLLTACDSRIRRVKVLAYRRWVRTGPAGAKLCRWDGDGAGAAPHLCGLVRIRLRARALGQTVHVVVVARYSGRRVDEGAWVPGVASSPLSD